MAQVTMSVEEYKELSNALDIVKRLIKNTELLFYNENLLSFNTNYDEDFSKYVKERFPEEYFKKVEELKVKKEEEKENKEDE